MDALQNTTQFAYQNGDLTSVIDPMLKTSTFYYDTVGRLLTRVDPLGHRTVTTYNPLNQVVKIVDALEGGGWPTMRVPHLFAAFAKGGNFLSINLECPYAPGSPLRAVLDSERLLRTGGY